MLVHLPQALSKSILNYLSVHSSDRLSVATSCRGLLNDVEAFSKNELHRITEEHAVDDDWLFRVGMQAAASAAMKADGQPWSMSSLVSQRRMLRSAYQTHLYSLGTDPLQRRRNVNCLAVHPDGKKLLSCDENDRHLDLWDLQTRERIRSFRGFSWGFCGFRSGRVVSQSVDIEPGIIQVWGLDGSCEVSHEFEEFVYTDLTTSSGEEVMWIDEQNVNALNLFTETTRHVRHGLNLSNICAERRKSFFCKDRLLVWIEYNGFDNENGVNYGIYVVDRSTLRELSRIEGRFHSFAVSRDGEVVARTHKEEGECFDVYHLEGDHLVFDRSLGIDDILSRESIVLLWNSKLYVSMAWDGNTPPGRIDVYNTATGELERKLYYPRSNFITEDAYMTPVQSRKEVLCGFGTFGGFHPDPHIRAYLLED